MRTHWCVSSLSNRYCSQTVAEAVGEVAEALEVERPPVESVVYLTPLSAAEAKP